jgi:hypothetical protein
VSYVETGGSWRPFWLVAALLAGLIAADVLLPVPDVPLVVWVLSGVVLLGTVAAGVVSARRAWTVRVGESALTVGRERIPLSDVDLAHLRAVRSGDAGVDAGAPVLGSGGPLPRGRNGLPLRLTDGRTVLVPTRDPAALTGALLAAAPDAPDGGGGARGTLAP